MLFMPHWALVISLDRSQGQAKGLDFREMRDNLNYLCKVVHLPKPYHYFVFFVAFYSQKQGFFYKKAYPQC